MFRPFSPPQEALQIGPLPEAVPENRLHDFSG